MKIDYPVGSTPLTHEELEALIPSHITMQEELNAWEEQNILEALPWAFKQKEILSLSFLQKLHKKMFNHTWRWAGEFRKTDKNIGIHWPFVATKVKELCDDVAYWQSHNTFSLEEIAIRFHHRLVWIHPFPNGNGRHTRLVADLYMMQREGRRFSWGAQQSLYKTSPIREQYIHALRQADKGDYSALLVFARS
jgi:Fic-DOC domain mobile mystery protein B